MSSGLERHQIESLIAKLPPEERLYLLARLNELDEARMRENATGGFIPFVEATWEGFIAGSHHRYMGDVFDDIIGLNKKRVIINIAPRHTKSMFGSVYLPAYFFGHYPKGKIIQASYNSELATGFGRQVREIVDSGPYQRLFRGVGLSPDSQAAGRWDTNQGGKYFAVGVGGNVTGMGADLLIIDDPHSEQEAALNNPDVYDKTYRWYMAGPRQRLQPGGTILIIMCMTGDTPVLRPDGTETPLRDIRVGDAVATYEDGQVSTSTVNNFRSSGVDAIFKVSTRSGRSIRANARHPFLVRDHGGERWVRLKDLSVGDSLVSLMDARDHRDPRQNPENAKPVSHWIRTTEKTQTQSECQSDTTGSGSASSAARMSAMAMSSLVDSVGHVTRDSTNLESRHQKNCVSAVSSIDMGSPSQNTTQWLNHRTDCAPYVVSHRLTETREHTGAESYALITATIQEKFVDCCATTATLQSGTEKHLKISSEHLNTFEVTVDEIVSIEACGYEEVFDVEIDRTENFIANGIVSHNTRWHERDLTGRVLKDSLEQKEGEEWELIEFPAILKENEPDERPLWPEFWSMEELKALRRELPPQNWNAQYQQNPTGEEGAIVKREWWKIWDRKTPPKCSFIIQAWDTAFTAKTTSDYSACSTWGVFEHEDIREPCIILLDSIKGRWEFPELKEVAHQQYMKWNPDSCIIEGRSTGNAMAAELRRRGLLVTEYVPSRGNDKITRVNSISDLFAQGRVFRPETGWAAELADDFASFPFGKNDDTVDAGTLALIRFRDGGFIALPNDDDFSDEPLHSRRSYGYY